MGAYRNNALLLQDDDFDLAIFLIGDQKSIKAQLETLRTVIDKQLPHPYQTRIVDTYCNKIEVYDPTYGNYKLQDPKYKVYDADFHHVTVDIQAYQRLGNIYTRLYASNSFDIPTELLFPFKSIDLSWHLFPCPNNIKAVLELTYGYIGINAIYDPISKKYKQKTKTTTKTKTTETKTTEAKLKSDAPTFQITSMKYKRFSCDIL